MKIYLHAVVLLVAYLHCASSAAVLPGPNEEVLDTKPDSQDTKDLEPQETWGFGYPRWGGYGGWGGYRGGYYPRSYGYGGYGGYHPRSYGYGGYGGYGGWGYGGGFGWGR